MSREPTTPTATTPEPPRSPRHTSRPGRPFAKGNGGRPRGTKNRRTAVGIETMRALSGQAVETVEKLLSSTSSRVRLEAARTILAYSFGLPKQTLEVGGLSDVAALLAEALHAARNARLTAVGAAPAVVAVAGLLPTPEAVPGDAPVRETGGTEAIPAGSEPVAPSRALSAPEKALSGSPEILPPPSALTAGEGGAREAVEVTISPETVDGAVELLEGRREESEP